jgi:hypothetical protein
LVTVLFEPGSAIDWLTVPFEASDTKSPALMSWEAGTVRSSVLAFMPDVNSRIMRPTLRLVFEIVAAVVALIMGIFMGFPSFRSRVFLAAH